ncbi:hypothetical protein F4V91_16430 [Neorhizobium galegae]|uniref:DUF4145 domain-containing protein n=1 Tax=Neorhizobium galegae TaxID=399 RepID=A0A6A1TYA8_NEOGA|nr:hypothetical protein [Neorhizobium galegae]KAB1087877.1 hypothetical protein F4V91_16430 [Neorhizobium galegae]
MSEPSDLFRNLTREDFKLISFDFEQLSKRLQGSEDWAKLVVCHIYLDHIISQTLKDHVPNIDAYFAGGHKSFSDKLALCQAHNLIDDEIAMTLRSINSARNKFAHRLVFDVPDEVKTRLFLEFSPARPPGDVLTDDGFSNFLFTVVMLVEFERIYGIKLANIEREAAFHRGKMLEIAIEMIGGGAFKSAN